MALLEVCVDSVAGARAAAAAGAHRVELCCALAEGGLTPSAGLIAGARAALDGSGTRLMVLLRPRGGDFVWSEDELQVMAADLRHAARAGAQGVVLGALTPGGQVDRAALAPLLALAWQLGLDVSCHRAFDMSADLGEALEALVGLGVPRVLTSGGQPTALQGADMLASLVRQAAGRIAVVAGAGVRPGNAAQLMARTGVRELHATAKRLHASASTWRPPGMSMCAPSPPSDWAWHVTDEAAVRELLAAMRSAAGDQPGGQGAG